jgi:hypothetical protein
VSDAQELASSCSSAISSWSFENDLDISSQKLALSRDELMLCDELERRCGLRMELEAAIEGTNDTFESVEPAVV